MRTQTPAGIAAMNGSKAGPTDIAVGGLQQADAVAPRLQDRIVERHAMKRAPQFWRSRRALRPCFYARHVGRDDTRTDHSPLQQHIPA